MVDSNNIPPQQTGNPPSSPAEGTKKKRPPKPGSKAARALSARSSPSPFVPPKCTHASIPNVGAPRTAGTVCILTFSDTRSLTAALGRPHVRYEGGKELRGPLKGINMPTESLKDWLDEVGAASCSEAERLVLNLVGIRVDVTKGGGDTDSRLADQVASMSLERDAAPEAAGGSSIDIDSRNDPEGSVENGRSSPLAAYVIACLAKDQSTLLHEYAHAVFYLSPAYRAECERMWSALGDDAKRAIEKELAFRNYAPEVTVDEFQAYVVEGPQEFGKKWTSRLADAHHTLKKLVGRPVNT
ncbi:hypothetical protein HK104_008374 [Borealophlyctis nickersoniae]|nr:hypothetical protein HK104_008374 [Borealophlyctis nickersoniae]